MDGAAVDEAGCSASIGEEAPRGAGLRGEIAIALLHEPSGSRAAYRLLQPGPNLSADADGSLARGMSRTWTRRELRTLRARHAARLHAESSAQHGAHRSPPLPPSDEALSWALGVASVNMHSCPPHPKQTGGPVLERGVLGLLCSMMEHDCQPSACTDVATGADGSAVLTLRTTRAVRAGERLSITYVPTGTPVDERRRQLRLLHGFVCACERCVAELAAVGNECDRAQAPRSRCAS